MKRKLQMTKREILKALVGSDARWGATSALSNLAHYQVLTTRNINLLLAKREAWGHFIRGTVRDVMEKALNKIVAKFAENTVGPFVRIFIKETIVIPATDGSKTFEDAFSSKAKALDFGKNRKTSKPTPRTEVAIYDAFSGGKDFRYIHRVFKKRSPKDLCLTEAQIAIFCRNRRKFLNKDRFTSFFYEENDGSFGLACVDFGDNYEHPKDRGWSIGSIEFGGEWCHQGDRIVIPVLKP